MYQSYQSYFNPYHPQQSPPAPSSPGTTAQQHHGQQQQQQHSQHYIEAAASPPSSSLKSQEGSPNSPPPSCSSVVLSQQQHSSKLSKRSLAYGATSDMQGQQHTSENNVYDGLQQQHQHLQSQQQQHYLSSSPHVQQPLPASTMASSVAALQRLSASIDVTAVPASGGGGPSAAAGGSSRSNSRASAYDEPCSDKSEVVQAAAAAALQSREAAEASGGADGRDPDSGGRPQYLTANCVVYSFYNGDLTAAIDDHFNRALKTTSNERDSPPNHSESVKQQSDSPVPMSQRNLPASFWICDYYHHQHSQQLVLQQQQQAAAAQQQQQQYDPYDAYVSAAADPWHNYMYHHSAHRSASDMYSQASRQYSSLLHLQSSAIARQAHQQGRQVAAALGKAPNDTWAAAAAVGSVAAVDGFSAAAASGHPHYSAAMTGLEGTMQGSSKDLYWF